MTSSPLHWLPSPCPTEDGRDTSMQPQQKPTTFSTVNMLKINSLLNPSTSEYGGQSEASFSRPPTPAYTTQTSSGASTPQPQTPTTPSSLKRQKLVKDGAVFIPGIPKEPINYPPHECNELAECLSPDDQAELARQHIRFNVDPRGKNGQGLIANFQRRIPYSSEKRSFSGKTNRDAFEVFTYTFRISEDGKKHVVMWDYQTGLVRLTPFFKALEYSKTTPARALTANPGLKELSHSITGGALVAQGYWMPFSCARAICLTFCYHIRWVLTPIFGPSFIKECLEPNHPQFGRFQVNHDIIRCAQLEADGQKSAYGQPGGQVDIPRSVPAPDVPGRQLRSRKERPTFKEGSLFGSDSDSPERDYTYGGTDSDFMAVSPKSMPSDSNSPGWTSINRLHGKTIATPANTGAGSLAKSLLAQPRYAPMSSWRDTDTVTSCPKTIKMPTGSHNKHRTHTRRMSEQNDSNYTSTADHLPGSESSESDDMDIVVTPLATRKRVRKAKATPASNGKSTKYHADDVRAAHWLINLSMRDSQLACGPKDMRGQKRRLSSI